MYISKGLSFVNLFQELIHQEHMNARKLSSQKNLHLHRIIENVDSGIKFYDEKKKKRNHFVKDIVYLLLLIFRLYKQIAILRVKYVKDLKS